MRDGHIDSSGVFYAGSVLISLVFAFAALPLGILADRELFGNMPVVNFKQVIPLFVLIFTASMQAAGAYQVGKRRLFEIAYGMLTAVIFVNIAMMTLPFFDITYNMSILAAVITTAAQFIFLAFWAAAFHRLYFNVFPKHPAIVVSDSEEDAVYCAEKVRAFSREFEVAAVIDVSELGTVLPLYDTVIAYKLNSGRLAALAEDCIAGGRRICVIPEMWELGIHKSHEFQFGDMIALRLSSLGMSKEQILLKRVIDITIALFALILTGVPLLVLAFAIFMEDKHFPIYSQERLTKGGRSFILYKLRTMVWEAERQTGPVLASADDTRVTKLGAFLRRTRLDELPQFWNVLKGDMSVVGPRPERLHFTEIYSREVPHFKLRLSVKAGITGMAHVYGRYDTPPDERIKLDLYYILNYSLRLDIKLIIETIRIMLSRSYAEGVKGKR